MNQKNNAKKLKALVLVVAVAGFVYVVLRYSLFLKDAMIYGKAYLYSQTITAAIVVVICLLAMIEFWKVCNRIGNDQSFSKENVRSFKIIAWEALLVGLTFLTRIILLLLVVQEKNTDATLYACLFAAGSIVAFILCRILSSLIQNAAELKEENDLTI